MGAYKCPACRGTDIGDNAGGLKCLGCSADLEFVPGPALAVLNPPPADAPPVAVASQLEADAEAEEPAAEVAVEVAPVEEQAGE